MKLLGLRTVGYKVGDLAAAKAWYSQILGIEPYFDEPFYVGFNVAGYELGLQPYEGEGEMPVSAAENALTYWGVEKVDEAFQNLLALGATAHENPTEVGGNIIIASVRDPWGNVFGIIDNPHFSL